MQLVCPYCKNTSQSTEECSHCRANIKWVYDIYCKSEIYYTKGYECSTRGNLTQAKKYLTQAIHLNKYQIEARNLLGIIEFECGEVGEALKQWKLSSLLQNNENKAIEYIEKLQKNPKDLQKYKEANKLYNEALKHLNQNSEDMAVIRLRKAIHLNPNFIEARNLLTLCFIERRYYQKAMEHISHVLQIDRYNPKALNYLKLVKLDEAKLDLSKEQPNIEKPSYTVFNKKYYKPQKVINRGHLLATAIFYFATGMVCMLGVQLGLILPNKTEGLKSQIYTLEGEKKALEKDLEILTKESNEKLLTLEEAVKKQKKYADELQKNTNKLRQQQKLSMAKEYANARAWTKAADELYNITIAELEQASRDEYESLKENVFPRATDELYTKGYSAYREGNDIEAMAEFEKAVLYGLDLVSGGKSLYYMGEIEEKNGNITKAKQCYERVIENYKGHSAYYWAQNRLKNLAE